MPSCRSITRPPATLSLLTLAGAATLAPAQLAPPPLQRTEQGIGDVEPLGITLRDMQIDLRQPTGFDGVFRLDRATAFGPSENLFMRIDGGITAVFPKSVYIPSRDGLIPTIPPGTIFYLGDLPAELRPRTARPIPGTNFVDLSLSHLAVPEPVNLTTAAAQSALTTDSPPGIAGGPTSLLPMRSVWTDDAYRSRRIAYLLESAAQSDRASKPIDPHK